MSRLLITYCVKQEVIFFNFNSFYIIYHPKSIVDRVVLIKNQNGYKRQILQQFVIHINEVVQLLLFSISNLLAVSTPNAIWDLRARTIVNLLFKLTTVILLFAFVTLGLTINTSERPMVCIYFNDTQLIVQRQSKL